MERLLSRSWTDWVASALAVTSVAGLVGAIAIEDANGAATQNASGVSSIGILVLIGAMPVLGGLIAARAPSNPVGWMLSGGAVCVAGALLAHGLAVRV